MKVTHLTPEEQEFIKGQNDPLLLGERCEYLPWFIVGIRLDDNTLVGTMILFNISGQSKKAEIGMNIFNSRGTLIAYKAFKEFVKESFERLNLNRIYAKVHSDNKRCISCLKRSGFFYEGTEREALLVDGVYKDVLIFSQIRKDLERGGSPCRSATKILQRLMKGKLISSLTH
jgi:RimJ/RimL family protein N-acetyltransferase